MCTHHVAEGERSNTGREESDDGEDEELDNDDDGNEEEEGVTEEEGEEEGEWGVRERGERMEEGCLGDTSIYSPSIREIVALYKLNNSPI